MTGIEAKGYFEGIYKNWNLLLCGKEALPLLPDRRQCEDRKCDCGEPLFQHVSGTWECPACEQF